jgi:poly-beta-1,6-N-acetyl-D-glucosamine synthase
MNTPSLPRYVLVTPARNEAEFIELTIRSVLAQTVRPVKWVIVSDGSTDGTDEIVNRFASEQPWIELVQMPGRRERHFAGKVNAFNAGYARLASVEYEVIASLDADISFDEGYFAFLLERLASDPALGVVGTPFQDDSVPAYDYRFVNIDHVSGACQVFRRQCFEQIGGYVPVKGGGIDYIAVTSARMKGWKTRTFVDKPCSHHRKIGTAQHGALAAKFKYGVKDYVLGNHPLWEVFRGIYQTTQRPFIVGGLMLVAGYIYALARQAERPVSNEFMAFVRNEQLERLGRLFARKRPASDALENPSQCS